MSMPPLAPPSSKAPTGEHDPVHLRNDGWYFWDETWSECYGPWGSEMAARSQLLRYCCVELSGEPDPAVIPPRNPTPEALWNRFDTLLSPVIRGLDSMQYGELLYQLVTEANRALT